MPDRQDRAFRQQTDRDLLDNMTRQASVSPLENELARRLEVYVQVYGAFDDTED